MSTFDIIDVITYPAIVALCLLIGYALQASTLDNKWIPVCVGFAGLALGLLSYWIVPDFPASDPIYAAAIGTVSGLASTGVYEVGKQLTKEDKS